MLSEEIIYLVEIYVDCAGEEVQPELQQRCNDVLSAEDSSDDSQHLVKKLVCIHFISGQSITTKLMNYLQPLLNSKEDAK